VKATTIGALLSAKPFEPFTLNMTSGDRRDILNPLFASVRPTANALEIYDDHKREHCCAVLDINHVQSIESGGAQSEDNHA